MKILTINDKAVPFPLNLIAIPIVMIVFLFIGFIFLLIGLLFLALITAPIWIIVLIMSLT